MREDDIAARCSAHAPVTESGHFVVGTVFGDWRTTAFIGRGGNGEVYCAEHVMLGASAAVKVLTRKDKRANVRFVREAKLLAQMKSKSFPRFFAYGEANGTTYLAMELLEPGDLPADDRAVAQFMLKVCDAVAELHAQGFVHRDIKPGNILWRSPSEPVLTDLGLAKDIAAAPLNHPDESLTVVDGRRAGVGTPGYGAPEQMERGEATEASDIHALGVLADQCFGGKPPRVWTRIIERATSSIPAHRYSTVAEFVRAIRWRHLMRCVIWSMVSLVSLVVVIAITYINLRYIDFNDDPLKNARPKVRQYDWKVPKYKYKLNSVTKFEGKAVLPGEVVLDPGKEYQIIGPGTFEADLFSPTTVVVRLRNCVLLNCTKRLYPENGIQYRLENAYLNFINVKKKPLGLRVQDFTGIYDGEYNHVRFGGPETVQELMEQINSERTNDLSETKW